MFIINSNAYYYQEPHINEANNESNNESNNEYDELKYEAPKDIMRSPSIEKNSMKENDNDYESGIMQNNNSISEDNKVNESAADIPKNVEEENKSYEKEKNDIVVNEYMKSKE